MNKLIGFTLVNLLGFASFAGAINKPVQRQHGFIENKGQIIDQNNQPNPAVKFLFNGNGLNVQLKANSFSYDTYRVEETPEKKSTKEGSSRDKFEIADENLTYHFHRIDVEFVGANPNPVIVSEQPSHDYTNYYTTGTPDEGVTFVRTYQKVTYKNLYDGIDMEFVVDGNGIPKFNFIIYPGGNVSQIRWAYKGAKDALLDNEKVVLLVSHGKIEEAIPESYLLETTRKVNVRYAHGGNGIFSFALPKYESNMTLIIDPIPWSTYFGGTGQDEGYGIATMPSGNSFVTGMTGSSSAIATSGAYQSTRNGTYDAFVTKFSASGARIWSTYFGGGLNDFGYGVKVATSGNVYVTGSTSSTDYISTPGAFQVSKRGGSDGFLTKFDSTGVRVWATYCGGDGGDNPKSICLDPSGNIGICGQTTSSLFLTSPGAYDTIYNGGSSTAPYDGFVAKYNSGGAQVWCSYYGGSGFEYTNGIASDLNGDFYFGGMTQSSTAIASSGAFDTTLSGSGSTNAYIVKFSASGGRLWGTYYGGIGSTYIYGLTTDASGNIYATGMTSTTSGFATTGAQDTTLEGCVDAFLLKFSSTGSRMWCTYFGSDGCEEMGNAVACDYAGNVYIVGETDSTVNLATPGAYQSSYAGGSHDVFLAKFNQLGTRIWSTYYGGNDYDEAEGVAVDFTGNVFITGRTYSLNGIATPGAYQTTKGGTYDVFVAAFTSSGSLPVNLVSFVASLRKESEVFCNWSTASEYENDYFEVLRSLNNEQWEPIGKVQGSGTISRFSEYSFVDANLPSLANLPANGIFYRLKQVDFNGAYQYSEIASVRLQEFVFADAPTVYPNPGCGIFQISASSVISVVEVFDLQGCLVFSQKDIGSSNVKLILSNLNAGMYFLKCIGRDHTTTSKIVIE